MRFLFELSGEHPTLPAREALAVLSLAGPSAVLDEDEGVLVAEAPPQAKGWLPRLAMSHSVLEHLASVPARREDVLEALAGAKGRLGATFAVRATRMGGAGRELSVATLEREAGARLAQPARVDLRAPETEVRAVLAARAHVGLLLHRVDRAAFESRHVRHRPFFAPITVHPRLARCMANLARVRSGERVLDPFCGTGGLAIEAGLLGARVTVGDLDPRMVEGAAHALEAAGVRHESRVADAAQAALSGAPWDAILTDPPYGRGASSHREPRLALYRRALDAFAKALRPGGRLVAAFPDPAVIPLVREVLTVEEVHAVRVHKSLTRQVVVARKDDG